MKLVIDIDERAYKDCVKLKNNDDMGVLEFHLINATANGTPLEEELEKIKEEVDEPMRDTTGSYGRGYACAMFKCLDILDNHIKELKGENNE